MSDGMPILPKFFVRPVRSLSAAKSDFANQQAGDVVQAGTGEAERADADDTPPPGMEDDGADSGGETVSEEAQAEPAPDPGETLDPAVFDSLREQVTEASNAASRFWQEQAAHLLDRMLGELFPRLAQDFFAEEVIAELRRLWPEDEPQIEISVPEHLAEAFSDALNAADSPSGWTLTTADTSEAVAARIAWPQGGAAFDFDRVLRNCHARLEQFRTTDRSD